MRLEQLLRETRCLLPRVNIFLVRTKRLILANRGDAGTMKRWVVFYHPTRFSLLQPLGSCLRTHSSTEIRRNIGLLFAFEWNLRPYRKYWPIICLFSWGSKCILSCCSPWPGRLLLLWPVLHSLVHPAWPSQWFVPQASGDNIGPRCLRIKNHPNPTCERLFLNK